jgi:hypothetical protein
MNYFQSILLCFVFTSAWTQIDQGTIDYSGRVYRAYDADGHYYDIAYEDQKSDDVLALIHFNSENTKIDAIVSIVYSYQVRHQKPKEWVLSFERLGSVKVVEAVMYYDFKIYEYDSLQLNYDTTKLIAGFSCHLASYECAGQAYEVWFTEELNIGPNLLTIPDDIPGTPLEFTLMMDMADVLYTATSFNPTAPNPKRFEMILPADYSLENESPFPIELLAPIQDEIIHLKEVEYDPSIPLPPPPIREDND